jgi:16S rRNA (uracil1498-N3)-methyltransferase
MSLPVHLVPSLAGVTVGDAVTVEGDEAHHAVAVRRLRVGEAVVLTDGAGAAVTGEVAETGKRVFTVTVTSRTDAPEPTPRVTVVQALPKGERGELAVEVLTEIGAAHGRSVAQVVLRWLTQRGVVAIPKSVRPERIRENLDVFGFELTDDEMARIAGLDTGVSAFFDHRDPAHVTRLNASRLRD